MHDAATVQPQYDIGVDYADMIFLPLAWKLTSRDYQLVVVDEAQDMTAAQLEIAERVCDGRICVVGDDRQSIYKFRGADSGALDRLKAKLGALELPLTTTYRCGTSIVEHAQRLVPDIQAGPDNLHGVVDACTPTELLTLVRPDDFVLSRLNAPLVSITLRLLRNGIRATMAGRDVGAGVVAILKKLKVTDWTPLSQVQSLVEGWERKQVTKLAALGVPEEIDRIRDQADVLYAFIMDADTTKEMFNKLDTLFTNVDGEPVTNSVLCSSVHKAKGLECRHVFVLKETFYRRGRTEEEDNCMYVAVTRAKEHLTLVSQ
jgi:superfamily I DNA/RNA helicase